MAKRRFNWKFALVLLLGFATLALTAYGLRSWRRKYMAEQGLELGNKAYEEERWQDAAQNLGRYIARVPDDVPALFKYAEAQLNIRPSKRNNIQQAIAAYRSILRIDKGNPEASGKLVEMYLQMNAPGEAEFIARETLQLKDDPKIHSFLAVALVQQRKFQEAFAELQNIIKNHPKEILAYEILGQLTEQRPKEFPDFPAEHWFNEAVKNNPSSAEAYVSRAAWYLRQNDKTKALADLEQAQKQDLSEPAILLRLAREFINAGDLEQAEKYLATVQKQDPKNLVLWQMQATLALAGNDKTKMLQVAEDGLKALAYLQWDFMPTAIELFIQSDQHDRAEACIAELRQQDFAPASLTFFEGIIADKKEQPNQAIKHFYEALEQGYKLPKVRLALVSALTRSGDTLSALQQLRTLVSEQPDHLQARLNLGRLLSQTGNWDQTAEQAFSAMQIAPRSVDAALLYIQARLHILSRSEVNSDAQDWQDIENRLAELEKATEGILAVKLVQLQMAMLREQFGMAEGLLEDLKKSDPSSLEVALAEVELLNLQDKNDQAIAKLEKAIGDFPESLSPVRTLAILLARQDDRKACENVVLDAIKRFNQPFAQHELGLFLADAYQTWGQKDKEYQLLDKLAQKLPNDITVKRRLLKSEKFAESKQISQQLIDQIKTIEGQNGRRWRWEQARLWYAESDFDNKYSQIVSLLKDNLNANPDDQESRMLLASVYERAGELHQAVSTYRQAYNRSPRSLPIITATVAILYKAKEYDEADAILNQAAREKLSNPTLTGLKLRGFLTRGEWGPGITILEDLVKNKPDNPQTRLLLANLKMREGRFDEAEILLNELRAEEPNSMPVVLVLIESNVRQGKSAEAIKLCDELVENSDNPSAYLIRARTFVLLDQPQQAEEDFAHAIAMAPGNADMWMNKSDFHRSLGQISEATDAIQKALSLEPSNTLIQKRTISLLLASNDSNLIQKGNTILDEALQVNPQDAELNLYKARFLLTVGTRPGIEQATNILQKLTEDNPEVADAWLLLGQLALQQSQPGNTLDLALKGLVSSPNNRDLLLLKARAEAFRSTALAIPTLKILREINPDDTEIALYLADIYTRADLTDKAVTLLQEQLSSCDDDDLRKCRIALAATQYKNGAKNEAIKELELLFASVPDDPFPLLTQARLLKDDQRWTELMEKVTKWYDTYSKGNDLLITIANDLLNTRQAEATKNAEDILRLVLARDSHNTGALQTLAMLLQTDNRIDESVVLYRQILDLTPENVIAINNLAWILCEEQGKFQEALQLTQRGLKINPDYIDILDTRGVAYYRLGQFEKATEDFIKCVELYPQWNPSAACSYFHLGRALAQLGQKHEAIKNLKQALDLNEKIGGLSETDIKEAQRLYEELSQGV